MMPAVARRARYMRPNGVLRDRRLGPYRAEWKNPEDERSEREGMRRETGGAEPRRVTRTPGVLRRRRRGANGGDRLGTNPLYQ